MVRKEFQVYKVREVPLEQLVATESKVYQVSREVKAHLAYKDFQVKREVAGATGLQGPPGLRGPDGFQGPPGPTGRSGNIIFIEHNP